MSDGHFHTGTYRGAITLCKSSHDFNGTDPTLWCELPKGHDGEWHVEKHVARWSLDHETFQWWAWEDWLVKGHWESVDPNSEPTERES